MDICDFPQPSKQFKLTFLDMKVKLKILPTFFEIFHSMYIKIYHVKPYG